LRKIIAAVLAAALLIIPAVAAAGDLSEGDDYSNIQTQPTKIGAAAPFTLRGTLDSSVIGGDIDCFSFTAGKSARYTFAYASDRQVFKPHIGLIKKPSGAEFLTVAQDKGKTPAETAEVVYDFNKGDEIIVVLTTSSAQPPTGKSPYTLTVQVSDMPSDIVAFSLPGIELTDVVIDTDTATVSAVAPADADLNGVVPEIEGALGDKAVFIPATDVAQDFTRPVIYKLSSEFGAIKEWTILVRTEGEKESIAELKEMFIDGEAMEGFSPEVTEYDITVPYAQESIGVVVKPVSLRCEVSEKFISRKLDVGGNTIAIDVTAENGDVTTYTINVLRESGELVEIGDTMEQTEEKEAGGLPSYVIILIVVAALALVGGVLFALRRKLFNKE